MNNIIFYIFKKRLNNIILLLKVIHYNNSNKTRLKYDYKLKAVYINLAHRLDRQEQVLKEFTKLGIVKPTRFNAIKNDNGALGCAMSHYSVIREWTPDSNDEMLMICEDDIQFHIRSDELTSLLDDFSSDSNLHVLCLGNKTGNRYNITEKLQLAVNIQTTSCYIIKSTIKDYLISSFSESIDKLSSGNTAKRFAIDILWKRLQYSHNFCIPVSKAVSQRDSYSDIQNNEVSYGT